MSDETVLRMEPLLQMYATVKIFAADGSVHVTHSGAECGQGIDTKVVQVLLIGQHVVDGE